jgi:hypothetical protein
MVSKVPRRQHRDAVSRARADALPINASDYPHVILSSDAERVVTESRTKQTKDKSPLRRR